MIKDWIDIVRSKEYFDLATACTNGDGLRVNEMIGGDTDFHTTYDYIYPTADLIPKGFPGKPPNFTAITHAHSLVNENNETHAEEPAPAQRCGGIAFIWGEINHGRVLASVDLCRDDGFPAMIEAIGLKKHYTNGKLNRKGQHPALSADYIFVRWFTENEVGRKNGPSVLTISNYKEYQKDGVFTGHKWSKLTPFWSQGVVRSRNLDKFLANLQGSQDPFSNNYFTNQEDEFIYMTDFA